MLSKEVREEHHDKKDTEAAKDPRKLRTVLYVVEREKYPGRHGDIDNDAEPKILTGNVWKKVAVRNVERQKWNSKKPANYDRL